MPRSFASSDSRERHRAGSSRGGLAWSDQRRATKAEGIAAAIEWRESRRCKELIPDAHHPSGTRICGALAYQPCIHRPEGIL